MGLLRTEEVISWQHSIVIPKLGLATDDATIVEGKDREGDRVVLLML